MSHLSGMISLLLATMFGGTLVIVPPFEPGAVLEAIARQRVTFMFLVPSMLRSLLDHPDVSTADLSSLRNITYGASPSPSTSWSAR
jgi:fatty-acyl-CoA synthase